ncbi:hypothetical protein [Streptomyces griseus]|uniref:hypothetical protein n=1 Tax=Streptomyces griseus TaxID=1911 RepID=UPI0036F9BA46
MIDARFWFDETNTFVDLGLDYIPRAGEAVNYTYESGRSVARTVKEIEWFVAADGKQSVVVTLAQAE